MRRGRALQVKERHLTMGLLLYLLQFLLVDMVFREMDPCFAGQDLAWSPRLTSRAEDKSFLPYRGSYLTIMSACVQGLLQVADIFSRHVLTVYYGASAMSHIERGFKRSH